MAEEMQPTTASQIDFSEEVAALEAEIAEDEETQEEAADESTEDEGEGEEEAEGEDEGEEAEEDDETAEDGGEDSELGDGAAAEESETGKEDEEDAEEGTVYTLVVNGREVEVDGEEALATLAQKGLAAVEKFAAAHKEAENAQFTMNAMLRDPTGFLQTVAAKQNGGNYEAARMQIGKICEDFLRPIYEEMAAKPDTQARMKAERELARERETHQGQNQNTQNTFSQEDLSWVQGLTNECDAALKAEDLPAGEGSEPLRKRMADLMLAAEHRREHMTPHQAAKLVRQERDAYHESLQKSAPKGRTKEKPSKAALKEARAKRSRKKKGVATRGKKQKGAGVKTFSGRDFIKGLDSAFDLEP